LLYCKCLSNVHMVLFTGSIKLQVLKFTHAI
jgi:hypothetical protein